MTESELLEQESVLAEYAGDLFRALKRRDRVSLGIAGRQAVRWFYSGGVGMYARCFR